MSNDKTVVKVSWYRDTKVDRFNRAVRLSQHYAKQSYTASEARSLAAALARHADAIDPPDNPDTATLMTEAFHAERAYGRELVAHLRHVAENTNHYPVPGVSHITEPTTGGPLGCGPCYVWRVLNGSPDAADVPVGSLDPLAENLRTGFRTEIVDADDGEPMIRVTEDDEPEVAGWQVELDEAVQGFYAPWSRGLDAESDARAYADMFGGTVRELHLGPVIHDASGPKQCQYTPLNWPDEATRCWRNEHDPDTTRHVWKERGALRTASRAAESFEEAIQAAVRNRAAREGR